MIDIHKVRKKGINIHAFIIFLAPSFGGVRVFIGNWNQVAIKEQLLIAK